MSAPTATPTTPLLHDYQLRLPTYEGPLDVLLRLIEHQQLPISDVSLMAVLDQFVAYIASRIDPAPGEIAEFAAIAGRLTLLKSRELLPRPAPDLEEDDPDDLVRQLEEYRAIKLAAATLAAVHGRAGFGRGAAIVHPPPTVAPLSVQSPRVLARALQRWLSRVPAEPLPVATRHATTLREMISRVFALLDRGEDASFTRFAASAISRQEQALAFLALLTLIRRHAVEATQPVLFGDITVRRYAGSTITLAPAATSEADGDG